MSGGRPDRGGDARPGVFAGARRSSRPSSSIKAPNSCRSSSSSACRNSTSARCPSGPTAPIPGRSRTSARVSSICGSRRRRAPVPSPSSLRSEVDGRGGGEEDRQDPAGQVDADRGELGDPGLEQLRPDGHAGDQRPGEVHPHLDRQREGPPSGRGRALEHGLISQRLQRGDPSGEHHDPLAGPCRLEADESRRARNPG